MDCSLTICSVSFRSASYLKLNRQLTVALNPRAAWKWIVVENTPEAAAGRLGREEGFTVLDGLPQTFAGPASGSYHHGTALNLSLPKIETRFALFLDPDFYIVRPEWMREVIQHMTENGLAFFGAPWHPRWIQKYRYFPCVQCMFVDLEKVDIREFDFTPDCPHLLVEPGSPPQAQAEEQKESGLLERSRMALAELARNLRLVTFSGVNCTHDTGFHVYDRFHVRKRLPSECVTPVYNLKTDYIGPKLPASPVGKLVNRVVPDNLSFIPTRPGYFTNEGFQSHGLPDMAGEGWEEFMWRGQPFGFHLRGHVRLERKGREKEMLGEIIDVFARRAPREQAAESRA
jgi:hypothetical protein